MCSAHPRVLIRLHHGMGRRRVTPARPLRRSKQVFGQRAFAECTRDILPRRLGVAAGVRTCPRCPPAALRGAGSAAQRQPATPTRSMTALYHIRGSGSLGTAVGDKSSKWTPNRPLLARCATLCWPQLVDRIGRKLCTGRTVATHGSTLAVILEDLFLQRQ